MSTPSTRIAELAGIIAKHTVTIDSTLRARGLPTPSFDPNVETAVPLDLTQQRDAVLDASQELHELLLPPMSMILQKAQQNMISMKAISQFNIANCFSPGETMSLEDLSASCGLAIKPLKHLMRHAMTMRIFTEPKKGVFAHTAASKMLRNPDCITWLELGTHDLWPSSVMVVDSLVQWPESEEPNHTGWNLAHKIEEPLYQKLGTDAEFAAKFGGTMSAITGNSPAFATAHISSSHDWASVANGLVVDVGGSHGVIAVELARKFKSLRIVSQDLESTIESAPSVPEDVADRVQLAAHNFFAPQTVTPDAYIFRLIFHNWSDKYAAQILQALIPALKQGARVLVQDAVMPDPGMIPTWREKELRGSDLIMKTYFNSWERDIDEWRELFARADPRFQFIGVTQPQGSALSLIEARWTD